MKTLKVIIAGGGTGGHIFPAIAVANALKKLYAPVEILFVGAKGKMEMEKVPQAGFNIEGIDIAGFNRSQLWKNWSLPYKLILSFIQVKKIFKSFHPDAVFGVGGYSSYPVLRYAQQKGIPNFLHEANSYAGKANIMLGKNATMVMVATGGMEKFFPSDKIIHTGNPVRSEINGTAVNMENAFEYFGLKKGLPTVLIMGGSLGAKSINQAMSAGLSRLIDNGIQVIWQTGKGNLNLLDPALRKNKMGCITEFISKMDYAYAAADLVVSRAGAIAIAEICATGKASILVPYPLAAEDHQTANAMTLVKEGAAILIKDADVSAQLTDTILSMVNDKEKINAIGQAASTLFTADADTRIAKEIINSVKES
ncbi:MAG: undecaprenyldiphospho-muramoylpentapeptide beta-N-acetylglucosaminyltransferase [Bacteroidota bacterium]|jgi:UDP-N-acetylglucosamine--N-acetylmuramyl-(pentapeptide) pyrophosphoryl-undecaprenol N-acetylglucosamine transferase